MCIAPAKLLSGALVPCRKCWQCRANKINDWVGRNIAESETAKASHSITLTYGRDENDNADHVRAAVLTYSDVQKYIRALRDDGYPCRYFAVGEYGSAKGRTHWHLMLYWLDKVPPHTLSPGGDETHRFRFTEKHWPHGWSYWEISNPASVRYVMKYLQKDVGKDERQSKVVMSKKPPLGHDYFVQLAGRYVKQGIAPLEPYYWFARVSDEYGKPQKFYMAGKTLDNFCQSYLDQWASTHGGHPPTSQMIEDYCDRQARLDQPLQQEPFRGRLAYPWVRPPNGGPIKFSEPHHSYYVEVDGKPLYWSFNDEGNRAWLAEIRTERHADQLRREHERRSEPGRYSAVKTGIR